MSQHEDKILVYRKDRTIYFFDDVEAASVGEAMKLLQEIEEETSTKPIKIIVNSEGGDCYNGLAMYDRIRQSEYHIITEGTGIVASRLS